MGEMTDDQLDSDARLEALTCGCGHAHVQSVGDGADAGCEEVATCGCWEWRAHKEVVE